MTREYQRLQRELLEKYRLDVTLTKRVFLVISYVDRTGADHVVRYEIYPRESDGGPPSPRKRANPMVGMGTSFFLKGLSGSALDTYWVSPSALDSIEIINR